MAMESREERIQKYAERVWRELVGCYGWGATYAWAEAYKRAEKAIKE